ncbi:RHS repeat-associated core domain-containing protein [archaeon]|jgi:RHS repeat-associated protein|nr:RHS repeat-associated core domain-containing protein [archaeon]
MKRGFVLVLAFLLCISFVSAKIPIKDISVSEINIDEQREESITRYIYGLNGLVASVSDSGINYYHSDRLKSNRLITNSFGEIIKQFNSLPFGQEIENTGIKFSFATGKELDESDLYHFGARYYDSDLGRFTSIDPVKENHAYSYVRNNPMNLVDPNGRDAVSLKQINLPSGYTNNIFESMRANFENVHNAGKYQCARGVSYAYQTWADISKDERIKNTKVTGNAWDMRKNIDNSILTKKVTAYSDFTSEELNLFKEGDIIGIYNRDSSYNTAAKVKLGNNNYYTHVGFVVDVLKDGNPIIAHFIKDTMKVETLSNLLSGKFEFRELLRPNHSIQVNLREWSKEYKETGSSSINTFHHTVSDNLPVELPIPD